MQLSAAIKWQNTFQSFLFCTDTAPVIDPRGTALMTGLQLDFTLLITTLWAGSSDAFQTTSQSIYLACSSSACLPGCYGRQSQQPCWSWGKHPLLSSPPPSQWLHWRKLSGWWKMTSPSVHADYSQSPPCPAHVWTLLAGLVAPSGPHGEGDQSVVSQILLALLDDRSDIAFFLRSLQEPPGLLKDYWELIPSLSSHYISNISVLDLLVVGFSFLILRKLQQQCRKQSTFLNFQGLNLFTAAPIE